MVKKICIKYVAPVIVKYVFSGMNIVEEDKTSNIGAGQDVNMPLSESWSGTYVLGEIQNS